jgi:hypothetical protein
MILYLGLSFGAMIFLIESGVMAASALIVEMPHV